MIRPHSEGAFYTVNVRELEEKAIFTRWRQEGVWDPRIKQWEVGALEAEERLAARLVFESSLLENPQEPQFERRCPACPFAPSLHCAGCTACYGKPHAWWCHGDTCVCGCPRSRHYQKTVRGLTMRDGSPYVIVRHCRGRKCGCVGFVDVESQGRFLAFPLTADEKAAVWDVVEGALMDLAFGVGAFAGLDGPEEQ